MRNIYFLILSIFAHFWMHDCEVTDVVFEFMQFPNDFLLFWL